MKILLLAAVLASASAATFGATREWRFDVSLDGRPIGEHNFMLEERANLREITSEARFRVRVLFVDAYRYEHRARESWRGDCLERLDARTVENGRQMHVVVPDGNPPPGKCVQTFAYWNPRILESSLLLNPQTGEYVPVTVLPMGRETIDGESAERYRLLGSGATPLQIDLWYTSARDWVALESRTPQGRLLRYARK